MIKPYGKSELVNCYLENCDATRQLNSTEVLTLVCDDDTVLDCHRIADGSMTPIDGFHTRDEVDSLISDNKAENNIFFPLPILLQVPPKFREYNKQTLILLDKTSKSIGYIENAEFFTYDLDVLCRHIFGLTDTKHPGVKRLIAGGDTFAGGKLKMVKEENELSKYCLSPKSCRDEIYKNEWNTCVGFQTRNVPHLAHEHLQRIALELFDGVLLHPVIGWKKEDDYRPEVVIETYKYMASNIYPKNKVILSGLQLQMKYAGPKEAVLHAIIRQNYGCTHFIVGRDHAGVGGYYGKYDAHRIFDDMGEFLDIEVLKLKGPFYCKKCKGIVTENTCGHAVQFHEEVSGTIIREKILQGEYPPEEFIRKEIVDEIRRFESPFVGGQ